jgi:hypothetical protein
VWPVLVHTGHQSLIHRLTLHPTCETGPPPRLAVRLRGLVDDPWPLAAPAGRHPLVIEMPANPPVTLSREKMRVEVPRPAILEILVDGHRLWAGNLELLPGLALPADARHAEALAAFVLPGSATVTDLVRSARQGLPGDVRRLGFPELAPAQAAAVLYGELAHASTPDYAYEPAPWSGGLEGQLVRLPQRVFADGQGTCLDLALLLASTVEHVRRLPVLLWVRLDEQTGHLIPGVRTDDNDVAPQPLVTGLDAVRASCRPDRTRLFDPNALFRRQPPDEADRAARRLLAQAWDAYLVDVQSARERGVWPLVVAEPPRLPDLTTPAVEEPVFVEHRNDLPHELVEELARGQVVFLLGDALDPGAAFSRARFACQVRQTAGSDVPDLAQACTLLESREGREALTAQARAFFSAGVAADRAPYEALARLPVRTVVSFYPDPLLEQVLGEHDPPFRILVEDDDLSALQPAQGSRELYLLGGSALTGRGLVLTERDHLHLEQRIAVLARGLRDRLALQTLVLLGCDLGDLTLQDLYLEATSHLSRGARPVYVAGAARAGDWSEPLHRVDKQPDELLAALGELTVAAPLPAPPTPSRATPQHVGRRPFKYLDYFEPEDADYFFGRDGDVARLVQEVLAAPSRVIVLCGRSGVGKTSLVKAGLMPALRQRGLAMAYLRCGPDPEEAVLRAVEVAAGRELVLVVDQTEEAFIKLARPVLDRFFATVRQRVSDRFGKTRMVFVIREDFLGVLTDHCRQLPRLLETVLLLGEMDREGAREAVVRPATRCEITVEDELVDAILDDLSPDTILPAHLQIVCDRLYQECGPRGPLTLKAYDGLGRAARILEGHLEQAMNRLPPHLQSPAREVLRALVTSECTKDLLTLDQVVGRTRLDRNLVDGTLHDLIHIQRLVREVPEPAPTRFELAHETLAASVASWLDQDEANTRRVQEIVDREVAASARLRDVRITAETLRLIDDYRDKLVLSAEAVKLLAATFLAQGQLVTFWKDLFDRLEIADRYDALLWRPARQSEEALEWALLNVAATGLADLPTVPFPQDVAEVLKRTVLQGSEHLVGPALDAAFQDAHFTLPGDFLVGLEGASPARLDAVLSTLAVLSGTDVEALRADTPQQYGWVLDNLGSAFVQAVAGAFARRGRLPEPWRSRLAELGPDAQYEALLYQPAQQDAEALRRLARHQRISDETSLPPEPALPAPHALRNVLGGEAMEVLLSLPPRSLPEPRASTLAYATLLGDLTLTVAVVRLVRCDLSENLAEAILKMLVAATDEAAEQIVLAWDEASLAWPADSSPEVIIAVAGAFARQGRLPEPWRSRLAALGPDTVSKLLIARRGRYDTEVIERSIPPDIVTSFVTAAEGSDSALAAALARLIEAVDRPKPPSTIAE